MSRIFEEGPNVVNLSLDDAYFFVMNMFVHDPCIHDFSLQGLGGSRATGAATCALRVASTPGGNSGGGGGDEANVIIDNSTVELLQKSSGVIEEQTTCNITNVLKGILKNMKKEDFTNDTLKILQGCLQVHFPGITEYTIYDIGTKNNLIDPSINKNYEKLQNEISLNDEEDEEDEEKEKDVVSEKRDEEIKRIINDAFIDGGDIAENICKALKEGGVSPKFEYEFKYIEGLITNKINTGKEQQGGGGYEFQMSTAKTFFQNKLQWTAPDAATNGFWFTNPYCNMLPNSGESITFKNDFASQLIKAFKYFNPNARDNDFIQIYDSSDLSGYKTTFDISKGILLSTINTIKNRLEELSNLTFENSFNDIPENIISKPKEDDFYLYKPQLKSICGYIKKAMGGSGTAQNRAYTQVYTSLLDIFSEDMFEQYSIENDMIKDENTTIKALFFIYELANIIIIYNYYKNLKIKSTIGYSLEWKNDMWESTKGGTHNNGNVATQLRSSALKQLKKDNYYLIIKHDILDGPVKITLGNLPLLLAQITDIATNLIIALNTAVDNRRRTDSSKLRVREADIIDFCLDTVVHSIVTPLKVIRSQTGPIPESEKIKFYDAFVGPRNNRIFRGSGKDKIIMKIFLNKFYPDKRINIEQQYSHKEVDAFPIDPIKYVGAEEAKTTATFDDSLKDLLVEKLNKNKIVDKKIIYINNAAQNIYHGRDDVGTTNIASVIDPQATFPKFKTKGGNIELSDMDITIKTSDNQIFYRVRVRVTDYNNQDGNLEVKIEAYLKIGEEVLIFKEFGNNDDLTGLTATEPITVNTSKKNPLQANICFNKLVETVTELFNQQKQRTNADGKLQDKDNGGKIHTKFVYKFLCNQSDNDVTNWQGKPDSLSAQQCRRQIIEASFQKGLGDFLQEVLGWAPNRGYTGTVSPTFSVINLRENTTYNLKAPSLDDFVVIQLNNDTPSGLRGLFFNDIRSNSNFWASADAGQYSSICGYLSNASFISENNGKWTKQWYPRYAVSIYPPPSSGGGGDKKKKKQKTRKKRRVKYSTIRRKSKKTRRSRRRKKKRRRHTTKN